MRKVTKQNFQATHYTPRLNYRFCFSNLAKYCAWISYAIVITLHINTHVIVKTRLWVHGIVFTFIGPSKTKRNAHVSLYRNTLLPQEQINETANDKQSVCCPEMK